MQSITRIIHAFCLFSRILAIYRSQNSSPEEQTTTRKAPWSTDPDCERGCVGPSYPISFEIFICVPECSSDRHSDTNCPSESRLLRLSSLLVGGPVLYSSCHRGLCILQVTLCVFNFKALVSATCKCTAMNTTNPKQNVLTVLKRLTHTHSHSNTQGLVVQ